MKAIKESVSLFVFDSKLIIMFTFILKILGLVKIVEWKILINSGFSCYLWEVATKQDLGIDFSLFNDKPTGEIDYF